MGDVPSVELRPLCQATYEMGDSATLSNGDLGLRMVSEIASARFEGERFRASLLGRAAADWARVDPDGRISIDVRLTLQTDDGAVVLMTYQGRGDMGSGTSYSAPLFETGDERYAWLTRIQAVGKCTFDETSVRYDLFELV